MKQNQTMQTIKLARTNRPETEMAANQELDTIDHQFATVEDHH